MAEADEASVRGDFDDAVLEHFGVATTFFRRDGRFFVRSDGPDGALEEYPVAYTFGAEPLQQLLIALPGGRLQALSVAWDTRPAGEGGQRWFHLYPGEPIPHDDVLHWTARAQNWNTMCAECHSTRLQRGYDLGRDAYDTTWSDLDVGCEACHGPGSLHVAGAGEGGLVELASPREWRFAAGVPIAQRTPTTGPRPELDTCGRCHARRAPLVDGWEPGAPLLDTHRPVLLEESLYFADGQIQDEVYVWGSFLQSRMHAAGVTCSDCHDPHSLAIEAPDATCARCHEPAVFARPQHHHHPAGSTGASCVSCHMPERTYMVVDARHDHSFRVPRPDLADELGTPDVCTACHAGRTSAWAAAALRGWGAGREGTSHFGEALHAGRRRAPGAAGALAALVADEAQPAIVRATALQLLAAQAGVPAARLSAAVSRGAAASDPLIRLAAAQAAPALAPPERLRRTGVLLEDPRKAVRVEAARALVDVPASLWRAEARRALTDALAEYRAAQQSNADRPAAHVNLASLHAQYGELSEARAEFAAALRLEPNYVPAWVNLADLFRLEGKEVDAEAALRRAVEIAPEVAAVHHALGLGLARQERVDEALVPLERAAQLAPQDPRFAYVYGVALHSTGDTSGALAVLADAHRRHPEDTELMWALATMARDAGRRDEALRWVAALEALLPGDPRLGRLRTDLETPPSDAP